MPRKRMRAKARRPDMTQEERDALMLAHAKEHYTPADIRMGHEQWVKKYGEVAGVTPNMDDFEVRYFVWTRWDRVTWPARRGYMPRKDPSKVTPTQFDAYENTETR